MSVIVKNKCAQKYQCAEVYWLKFFNFSLYQEDFFKRNSSSAHPLPMSDMQMSKSCQRIYLSHVLWISLFNYKFIIFNANTESDSYHFSKRIVLSDFPAHNYKLTLIWPTTLILHDSVSFLLVTEEVMSFIQFWMRNRIHFWKSFDWK